MRIVVFERERRERLRSPEERVGTLPNGALPPPSTDEELLERALIDGDEPALDEVLRRLAPSMLHVAMTHVRTRAEAEDVVQEAWLGALRSIARFEGRSSIKTWLFRILKNRARTRGARLARTVTFSDLEAIGPSDVLTPAADTSALHGAAALEPDRALLLLEMGERIERAIDTLPARQRDVLTMRGIEGRSAAEVSTALGITDGNQRVLLHRARTRIRDQLGGYLDDDDGSGPPGRLHARWSRGIHSAWIHPHPHHETMRRAS